MLAGAVSLKSLFLNAAAIGDPKAREEFLLARCGSDAELLARVQALLAAHDEATALGGGAVNSISEQSDTADFSGRDERVGAVVAGKYKLLEKIGEGGMGSVYMAQQTAPVKRVVAVKVIKAGMDSGTVLARFEAERQALALMDHPNIASVLDAGTTDRGRPFFVMELVKGVPITQYCDEQKLTPRQRLELFVPVCHAIQHAHQKGVIHRDIKPSNIMVALFDDRPVPKVIDFGVAKATGSALTDMTLMTGYGTVVGTPEYMSPEQANLNNLDIDTRSDVYSLGVLLYELLTGTTPVDRRSLGKAALLEVLQIVRDAETPKPSSKLSANASLPEVAANRGTEPARLSRILKGELDWVLLKALEKDRNRRYETANGFARDIQRYLADEIVEARPPSTIYRVRKFVRRHKGQVLAASLMLLTLLAGIVGTTIGLFEARKQGRLAVAAGERETLRADAEVRERQRADQEKQRAVRTLERALNTLRATTDFDVEKLIGSKSELTAHERDYLEAIAERWLDFARQSETDADVRDYPAEGRSRVASLWRKLGRHDEARKQYEMARDLQLALIVRYPDVPAYRKRLGAIRNNLGVMLAMLGLREQAWTELLAARDLRRTLINEEPSENSHRKELAQTLQNMGMQLAEIGKLDEARKELETALELYMQICTSDPVNFDYQNELGNVHVNLGTLLVLFKDWTKAQTSLRASCDIRTKLVQQFPAVPEYKLHLAQSHGSLAHMLASQGRREDACREFVIARDLQQKLTVQYPAVPQYQQAYAHTANGLGIVLYEIGKLDEAREHYKLAHEIRKKLVEQYPTLPQYQIDLGGSYCNAGQLLCSEGKPHHGLESFHQAIRILQPVHEREPRDVNAKTFLRNSYLSRAQTYYQMRNFDEGRKDWDRVVELSPPGERVSLRYRQDLSRLRSIPVLEAAAELQVLTERDTWTGDQWSDYACIYAVASARFPDRKTEFGDRAMAALQRAVAAGFQDLEQLKSDTELDPLRDREDYRKLIAELERKLKSPPLEPPGKK